MTSDDVFADYSIETPLDGAGLDRLRDAILNPQSLSLRKALHEAHTGGHREYYLSDAFRDVCAEGYAEDEMLFRSEALERMVLCNTVGDRLGGLSELGKPLWTLREVNEWGAKTYKPLDIAWDWPALERLIRARVHGTETIGASNSLQFLWMHYDPAPLLPAMPAPDEATKARLAKQLRRLEAAEQVTRDSDGRKGYFTPEDAKLLEALAALLGRPSATLDRIEQERSATRAERQRLVDSVSQSWRDLFDAMFDLKHVSGSRRDPAEQAVIDLPAYQSLAKADDATRGAALGEIAAMQTHLERVRDRKEDVPAGVQAGSGLGEIGHPIAGGFLAALATLLLKKPVTCDDPTMAALVTKARNWRALCQPALLDSAERTLAAGPAPATEAALRQLAEQPSHCYVPTPGRGGDHEGDAWWQDTPGRVRAMLADRPPPAPPTPPAPPRRPPGPLGRILFGRKGT